MPKLMMITYHFPPSAASGSFRLLGFAQHLPKFGWDTIVIAPPTLPWEPNDTALSKRVPAETTIVPVPYPAAAPKAMRWFAPYAIWIPFARRAARKAVKEHKPDVVLTSGPPHWVHLVGRYIQKRFKLPWVADFRDPWITETFLSQSSALIRRIELSCERRTMHKASLILHNAPKACALLQKAYPKEADRMRYLTNGYDPESFPPVIGRPPEPDKGTEQNPIRIMHAGQLYAGRDPRPLLDAIAQIPVGGPTFRLEFMGRTEYEKGTDLLSEAKKRGVEKRVAALPQTGYAESLTQMAATDILLLMDSAGRKLGVPAKLYEYLGAARPILATADLEGDLAPLLKESGTLHRIASPNDVPAIKNAIMDLVQAVASGNVPPLSDETRLKFSRQSLAGKLAEMLNTLRG